MASFESSNEFHKGYFRLPGKEKARMAYTLQGAAQTNCDTLIIFLNGLILPRLAWEKVMVHLNGTTKMAGVASPMLLSYDRYGQGDSDPDPSDVGKEEGFGHDALDAANDLYLLLQRFTAEHLDGLELTSLKIVLVGNSLGCAIARLFTQAHPALVSGLLFLDSIIANSDLVSFFPDPDASDFDGRLLPEGVTADMLRSARAKYMQIFHPSVRNTEGISRKNLAQLLPESSNPKLLDQTGRSPYLFVVGHDPERFAEEAWTGQFQIPRVLSLTYHSPFWHTYNKGLVHLVGESYRRVPIIAKNCGHFIQRDDPEKVAAFITAMSFAIRDEG